MQIDKFASNAIARTYVQQADTARAQNAAVSGKDGDKAAQSASRVDSVVLSDNARSLAQARETVRQAADVREDKVSAIKQRVADGTYSVPSHVLARKLIDTSDQV